MTKTSVAGTLGLGVEYFVADNIALGLEGGYLFAPDATLKVQGVNEKVKISAPIVTFGMRLFYPELAPAPMAEARSDVPARIYIGARAGRPHAQYRADPRVEAEPSNNAIGGTLSPTFGASLGVNFGRYFGVEVAVDGFENNMNVNGLGNIGEWAVYTIIPYFRLRYPMSRDRLQPYLLAGFGYGHTEFNDRKPPGANVSISADNDTWAMGVGAGVEYFVADHFAHAGDLFFAARYLRCSIALVPGQPPRAAASAFGSTATTSSGRSPALLVAMTGIRDPA